MIKVENNTVSVNGISIQFDSTTSLNSFLLDYVSKHEQVVSQVEKIIIEKPFNYKLQMLIDTCGYIEIEELGLSVRSFNCLKRAGINIIKDVLELDYERIIRVRNLGIRSIREIESVVNEFTRSNYINWSESLPPVAVEN
jgi:DNA-directed RNA polymerase subunit alpha